MSGYGNLDLMSSRFANYFLLLSMMFSLNTAHSMSCRNLLKSSMSITNFLKPLEVSNLVKNVNLHADLNTKSLDPSLNHTVYSLKDKGRIEGLEFLFQNMTAKDRILKTDYGYALLDVNELRDWSLLHSVIKDQSDAKKFIDSVANTDGLYPNGITKEAADWLRWSVFANEESYKAALKKSKNPIDDPLDFSFDIYKVKKAEYRQLVRQKELIMFPFGLDVRYEQNEISNNDAPSVLATLARGFILSKMYSKRPDGQYRQFSEFLDRDSLMLFSRFPELLPSSPVFEGGHFSIDHEYVRVGREDSYTLSKKSFATTKFKGGIKYDLDFITDASDLEIGDTGLEVTAFFRLYFYDKTQSEDIVYENVTEKDFKSIFSQEKEKMNKFLADKRTEFNELTGYDLPESRVVEEIDSEYRSREFIVSFGDAIIPEHVLSAFYVFAGLN